MWAGLRSHPVQRTDLRRLPPAERERERSRLLAFAPKRSTDRGLTHSDALRVEQPDLPAEILADMIARLAKSKKRMPSAGTNAILYQLTRAVAHASGLGVCHRDIRPANITVRACTRIHTRTRTRAHSVTHPHSTHTHSHTLTVTHVRARTHARTRLRKR